MVTGEKLLKTRVGIFVFISFAMLALMVVYFGRLGDGFRHYYRINVQFPNASGLLKGADVLMAGSKVGMVAEQPKIIQRKDGVGVEVPLQIYSDIKIPNESKLVIGMSGLLGDRYVDILIPNEKVWKSAPIPANGTVTGSREAGIEDLVADVREQLKKVDGAVTRINNTVLSQETLQQAAAAIANLNTTTKRFADASGQINDVMDSAKKSSTALQATLADINVMIHDAKDGKGVLGTLLTDRSMADNLKAFVLNLREHGILWYKDGKPAAAPSH